MATLIFNFFSFLVISPGNIKIMLTSALKKQEVFIDPKRNKNSKVNLDISVNLKYKCIVKLIIWLEGIGIRITKPKWTSLEIDRRDEYGEMINFDRPSKEVIIDVLGITDSATSGEIYMLLEMRSSLTITKKGLLKAEIVSLSQNKFKKCIFKVLSNIILDMESCMVNITNIDAKGDY